MLALIPADRRRAGLRGKVRLMSIFLQVRFVLPRELK